MFKNKKNTLILVIVGGLVSLVAIWGLFFTGGSNSDNGDSTEVAYKTLEEGSEDASLSQEAAKMLDSVDVSGFSSEELYDHYLMQAELLMGSTDYESAAVVYGRAAEVNPGESSILIAQAEAYIAAGDAESAEQSYQRALTVYQESGAEGAEQYAEYIQYQIDNADAAIDYGPIYDGRTLDDDEGLSDSAEEEQ